MKKMFFLILFSGMLFSDAMAQKAPVIIEAGDVADLVFGASMKVVLVQTSELKNDVSFHAASTHLYKISLNANQLEIEPKSILTNPDLIYVLVNNVEKISLGENTLLLTQGMIIAREIQVILDRGAQARIRTNARIEANGINDADVRVTRNPAYLNATTSITEAFVH